MNFLLEEALKELTIPSTTITSKVVFVQSLEANEMVVIQSLYANKVVFVECLEMMKDAKLVWNFLIVSLWNLLIGR